MPIETFDAIVVGAGQAGPAIAERCSREGLRTAVIERAEFGGTCVNNGCIPTKTLVGSARAIHLARRGEEFGFATGRLRVDFARVMARKDAVVQQSREGVQKWVEGLDRAEVIRGEARFVAPGRLRVGDRELSAPRIFLNVGARAARPPLKGIDTVPTLDNDSMMRLDELPRHLVIVGGSYIGLEFAQMMRRFGAKVTVVEKSERLLPREDEDVSQQIQAILEKEGVRFELGAECISLAPRKNGIAVGASCQRQVPRIVGSHVLLAVGRQPNTDGLDLKAAGIDTDQRGYIRVDEQCRTSADGVWAVGECNGRGAFTHTAWNDHEVVVANLFDHDPRKLSDRIDAYALYIDPPLGRVGMSEAKARESGRPQLTASLPMARVGRAREAGETQGVMKVVVDAESRRLLGASLLGYRCDEAVHGLLDLMTLKQPVDALIRSMPIHPTVSELLPTLLQKLEPLKD
ncbi:MULTISPECIES: FAD-containing oxidoreductase [Hydrogenophaga]|uniref:Mercuric reductase n=1 Tax=Hydrogenophaga intermedia TaxID=65786 RepID=A0A1L1PKA8_HYDIT|nr:MULTISPECIES: FAD-containing oxidoreductase [Hydrogenophaga]AOS81874.1 mercuric reductase [Hydrogenophaga sp. PBC]TMU72635.1 FAD-containing oxidoreductase [Hydrogenophaga intermedia]CDN89810.1 Mercuric reductase [Hydrogenophaga intermedia]